MTRAAWWLAACGAAQIALTLAAARVLAAGLFFGLVGFIVLAFMQGALYFAALRLARRNSKAVPLWLILAFAVALRCCVLFSPPQLSDDIYRYVWDGRVQGAGINPYRYVPDAPALEPLRDAAIHPNINRGSYAHTIYPPVAQMFFFAATRVSQSVIWMKAAMTACDLFAMGALLWLLRALSLPRWRILIYAWHPLIIWEFAGNGHVDALAIAFILLALCAYHRGRDLWAGASLAAAVAVKMFPLMLLPALFRRWRWTLPLALAATLALVYLPYLSVGWGVFGFLPHYADEEGLGNGQRFYPLTVVRHMLGLAGTDWGANVYMALFVAILAAIALASIYQDDDPRTRIRWAAVMVCVFTVLFTPHYAWYFAWVVPFMVFEPFLPMLFLTVACIGLYAVKLIKTEPAEFIIFSAVYVPFYILLLYALVMESRRRSRSEARPAQRQVRRRTGHIS